MAGIEPPGGGRRFSIRGQPLPLRINGVVWPERRKQERRVALRGRDAFGVCHAPHANDVVVGIDCLIARREPLPDLADPVRIAKSNQLAFSGIAIEVPAD